MLDTSEKVDEDDTTSQSNEGDQWIHNKEDSGSSEDSGSNSDSDRESAPDTMEHQSQADSVDDEVSETGSADLQKNERKPIIVS